MYAEDYFRRYVFWKVVQFWKLCNDAVDASKSYKKDECKLNACRLGSFPVTNISQAYLKHKSRWELFSKVLVHISRSSAMREQQVRDI